MNHIKFKVLFSAFTFFFVMFFRWDGLDPTLMGWANNSLILAFLIVNRDIFKLARCPEYKWINLIALLWALIVIYSAYQNHTTTFDLVVWDSYAQRFDITTRGAIGLSYSIYFVIKFLMFILYFEYLSINNGSKLFLKYLFPFLLVFVMLSDINGFIYVSEGIGGYKTGNKFYICYLNIFLVTIYLLKNGITEFSKRRKSFIKTLLIITFLLSIKTECTTMIIGTLFYYAMLFWYSKRHIYKLYKPVFFLMCLFCFDILFFILVPAILELPFVQYIVVDILGENLTLTGRLIIYEQIGTVLEDCPLYGFGLGNSNLTTLRYDVGPNAQNGLLNYFIELGLLGTFLFFGLLQLMIVKAKTYNESYPVICFIYMMILLSSVEITFSTYFMSIAIMLLLHHAQTESYEKNWNNYSTSPA